MKRIAPALISLACAAVAPAVVHPWRWLYRPHAGPIGSYSAWRKGLRALDDGGRSSGR